jgi:hypothetical protein
MFSAALAAIPIAGAESDSAADRAPLLVIDAAQAYRECITELCALASPWEIDGLAFFGSCVPGLPGVGFRRGWSLAV